MTPPPLPPEDAVNAALRAARPTKRPPWWARIFAPAPPPPAAVSLMRWDDALSSAFTRQRVLHVYAQSGVLPLAVLPSGSMGYVVWDDGDLHPLSHEDDSLGRALAREGQPLDAFTTPTALARLICAARLQAGPERHVLITGPDQLAALTPAQLGLPASTKPYELSPGLIERLEARTAEPPLAPTLSGQPHTGWELTFTTLKGWMHEVQDLGLERVFITPAFEVVVSKRKTLEAETFAYVPGVRY